MRGVIEVRRWVDLTDIAGYGIADDGERVPAHAGVTDTSPPDDYDPDALPAVVDAQLCPMTGWTRVDALTWRATDPNGQTAVVRLIPG